MPKWNKITDIQPEHNQVVLTRRCFEGCGKQYLSQWVLEKFVKMAIECPKKYNDTYCLWRSVNSGGLMVTSLSESRDISGNDQWMSIDDDA